MASKLRETAKTTALKSGKKLKDLATSAEETMGSATVRQAPPGVKKYFKKGGMVKGGRDYCK